MFRRVSNTNTVHMHSRNALSHSNTLTTMRHTFRPRARVAPQNVKMYLYVKNELYSFYVLISIAIKSTASLYIYLGICFYGCNRKT